MRIFHFVQCRNYVCPRCAAAVGEVCKQPSGKRSKYPHKERLRCLSAEEKAQGIINAQYERLIRS